MRDSRRTSQEGKGREDAARRNSPDAHARCHPVLAGVVCSRGRVRIKGDSARRSWREPRLEISASVPNVLMLMCVRGPRGMLAPGLAQGGKLRFLTSTSRLGSARRGQLPRRPLWPVHPDVS